MKKSILTGLIAALFIMVGGTFWLFSSETVRQWLYAEGIKALSETLHTRVKVDKIDVDFRNGGVALYGFEMDDLDHVTMMRVDTLEAGLQLWPLLSKEVIIDKIRLHGVKAVLYKERPDTAANYQFVIDAFKHSNKADEEDESDNDDEEEEPLNLYARLTVFDVYRADFSWDVKSKPVKGRGKLDVNHMNLRNFSMKVGGDIMVEQEGDVKFTHLSAEEKNSGARFSTKSMELRLLQGHSAAFVIRGLNYQTDNGKPRKNKLNPHKGAFDVGHLDLIVNADVSVNDIEKENYSLTINNLNIFDKGSGLDIRNITADVIKSGDDIYVKNTSIAMANTRLTMGTVHLTNTEDSDDTFGLLPVQVNAHVVLSDIAKPFAPVLSNFTTPLKLNVTCSGNLDRILFSDIVVTSHHKRLIIHADGDLCNVAKKQKLSLHFWGIQMVARSGIKEQIVGHFAKKVNLKMQRQMRELGDIRYDNGTVEVLYKRVNVGGDIITDFGNVNFGFNIDGFTKYMTGTMKTSSFEIGKLMQLKSVGPVDAQATYSFNTSKDSYKIGKSWGKLPIGTLSAKIDNVTYGILRFHHLTADFNSDGSNAVGSIVVKLKRRNIVLDVNYHQTEDDLSYSWKIRLKKISDEEKQARKEEWAREKAANP